MIKSGLAIEKWKLPFFKKGLDKEGYKYTEHNVNDECVVLKIDTYSVIKLASLIEKMNYAAACSRAH